MDSADRQSRPPRGALIVLAVGLVASLAAALLSNEDLVGAAQLQWTAEADIPDSAPATVPGGEQQMRLREGRIRASEPNIAGFKLYRVSAVLEIDGGAPIGRARLECTTEVPKHVIVAKTTERRAAFPLSTSDEAKLQKQEVKEKLLLQFSARSSSLSALEYEDVFDAYTNIDGVKVEWPPFRPGYASWRWFLPEGVHDEQVRLGFASVWRTRRAPVAANSCTLTNGDGSATVRNRAAIG